MLIVAMPIAQLSLSLVEVSEYLFSPPVLRELSYSFDSLFVYDKEDTPFLYASCARLCYEL